MGGRGWSKGCYMCRQRKVRCDEGRPACMNCARRKQPCRYRDSGKFHWKSMNGHVARTAAVPASAHAAPGSLTAGTTNAYVEPYLQIQKLQPASVEDVAVSHFMRSWILKPTHSGRLGYLDCIPQLFVENKHDLALKHAVLACSTASYANVYNLPDVKVGSLRHYGLALSHARRNLSCSTSAKSDSSLASIVLLQLFEIVKGLEVESQSHHDEALDRIVKLRTQEEQSTAVGVQLSFVIQSQRQIREFGSHKPYSAPIIEQPKTSISSTALPTYTNIWQLLAQISHVTQLIRQAVAHPPDCVKLNAVVELALNMYAELIRWPRTIREKDRYRTVPNLDAPSSLPLYPPVHHLFDSIQHGALWVAFWCAEIQYLQQLKSLSNMVVEVQSEKTLWNESLRGHITYQTSTAIDHICGMAKFMLGDMMEAGDRMEPGSGQMQSSLGAFFLLRGLYVVTQVDSITEKQRTFVFDTLTRIGRAKGIELALRCRDHLVAEV